MNKRILSYCCKKHTKDLFHLNGEYRLIHLIFIDFNKYSILQKVLGMEHSAIEWKENNHTSKQIVEWVWCTRFCLKILKGHCRSALCSRQETLKMIGISFRASFVSRSNFLTFILIKYIVPICCNWNMEGIKYELRKYIHGTAIPSFLCCWLV